MDIRLHYGLMLIAFVIVFVYIREEYITSSYRLEIEFPYAL